MTTMGPIQGGKNEDIPRPTKPLPPLPTAPSENEMTVPQNLAPKKPLPLPLPLIDDEHGSPGEYFDDEEENVEDSSESFGDAKGIDFDEASTEEVENFGGAQGIDFGKPPESPKSEKPASVDSSPSSSARGSQRLKSLSTGSAFGRQYMAVPPETDSQQKKSFSLINSLKSFSSMVSSSKIGKFFSEIGPSIKASAFGTAIRGAFAKREGKSSEKASGQLAAMLSPQSGKTLEDRFRQVFKDPSSRAELEAYCKKNHQMETFNFMEKFIHFEKVPSLSTANEIMLQFLGDEPPEPINVKNIPQKIENLQTALNDKKIMDTFPIFRECFTTLANTLYQNMQTSL